MKKQRVLFVHNYYQIPGGEDTVVENEMRLLKERGHEVFFYSRNNSELKEMSWYEKIMLPVNTIFNFKTYKEIKEIIITKGIDIVHVHNTLNLISPSVYYAAKKCKVPVVQTVHNFRFLCPAAIFYRDNQICEDCLSKGLMCAVKHNCYRNSKLQTVACVINTKLHRLTGILGKINYICLTEFNKEKLLTLKQIKSDRVFIKPNFVESNTEIIPIENRKQQVVFAGRLDKLKGIDILLEVWKRMGNCAPKLVICGTGPMEKWCQDFIANHDLGNVEMRGFVPNIEVRKILGESLALILPTQCYEGFPMSIVEAFSMGTPVICSDFGNSGSLVVQGVTGYKVKADSLEGLEYSINEIRKSSSIHQATRKTYLEFYTEKRNYQIIGEIYNLVR